METPEVKERLLQFIKTMGLSVAQFERRAGLSNGYIRNFRGSFGGNKFDMILEAFPMLNREWVTMGRGEMMLQRPVADTKQESEETAEAPIEEEATATEVSHEGHKIVFNVSKEQLDSYAKLAQHVLTDWQAKYENAQREVDTLKMLLELTKEQLATSQKQLQTAMEQIGVLHAQLTSENKKK